MTHLGLISAVAASEKKCQIICFDPDEKRINELLDNNFPVSEPRLQELILKNRKYLTFTYNSNLLNTCDIVYVAPDVSTDDNGQSDLRYINNLIDLVYTFTKKDTTLVILSQVPPGFTRSKLKPGRTLLYQVETLIFGRAIDRALYPERYIVGCDDPCQPLPLSFKKFLELHNCPILPMRYESAELAKISINMCLVASVTTANVLAEICENIGADWSEIVPALKLDKRIGSYAYLKPGLGIAGGNLERDLATIINLGNLYDADIKMVKAWLFNSLHRKSWASKKIREILLDNNKHAKLGILGLSYKEDTRSIKNSPSLHVISELQEFNVSVYDPLVKWDSKWHPKAKVFESVNDLMQDIDALLILTPWNEFREINFNTLKQKVRSKIIIDPYSMLDRNEALKNGLIIFTLGK